MKRLVVNVVGGPEARAEHEVTKANHEAYADRCGADYKVIIPDRVPEYAPSVKYAVAEAATGYGQTLILDVDTVVAKKCPNIFDEVPKGYWGVIDEAWRTDSNWDEQVQVMADGIADSLGIPRMVLIRKVNSGVMVLPKNAKDWYWPPKKEVPKTWVFEQLYLSMKLQAEYAPVVELDVRFNWSACNRDFHAFMWDAFIVHLAGIKDRVAWLKTLVASL